ncbi:hypothetical protein H6P81_004008 [Aristolochia fimbriata]|uniref:Histidine kinase domain-containing protein n=1 Tax=Aristolochia fimbriata TaxID=158543 RepID=A0AAV7FE69_ARIFI|nr:hypothetical protein H6P81_004008 [Aristolochia fimbriata]
MGTCKCSEMQCFPKYQYQLDLLVVPVYFFISLSVTLLVWKFPLHCHRPVLMLLGLFTVISGITELMSLAMCTPYFKTMAAVLASVKVSSACVLLAAVFMLFRPTRELEKLRLHTHNLMRKAKEVDQVLTRLHAQKEARLRSTQMMQRVNSSLDKYDILRTVVSELGKSLDLEECSLWMPTDNGSKLLLCRTFRHQKTIGMVEHVGDSLVQQIFRSEKAIKIPTTCSLARSATVDGRLVSDEIVASRVSLPKFSFFQSNGSPEFQSDGYAVLVLMFPVESGRRWHDHEMELVDSVIQQIAVALSHASIVEESIEFHGRLKEHSFYLEMKSETAERILCLHRDFVTIMSKLMHMPLLSLSASTSLLQETTITPRQHLLVEGMSRTTHFLADLITDVSELSGIEEGSIQFTLTIFNLHSLFQEILDSVKPVAAIKKLSLSYLLEADVPDVVIGDAKRIRQVILNVVSNAIKFTTNGGVSISVSTARPDVIADLPDPISYPSWNDQSYLLQLKVEDTGCGFSPPDIPIRFAKYTGNLIKTEDSSRMQSNNGLALSLSMRIVELMGGMLTLHSKGPGRGSTATVIARLGTRDGREEAGDPECESVATQ